MNSARAFYTKTGVIIVGILLALFFGYHLYGYIRGPYISASNVDEYETSSGYVFDFELQTKYAQKAWINQNPAELTNDGIIRGHIALHPGTNVFVIRLQDRFGHMNQEVFEITAPSEEFNLPNYNEAQIQAQEQEDEDIDEDVESTETQDIQELSEPNDESSTIGGE